MFAVPLAWVGVFAVIEVLLTTETLVAADPPMVTVAPARKFAPVIVTPVPPPAGPELGDTDVTEGAGFPPPEPFNRTKLATDGTPLLLIRKSM